MEQVLEFANVEFRGHLGVKMSLSAGRPFMAPLCPKAIVFPDKGRKRLARSRLGKWEKPGAK